MPAANPFGSDVTLLSYAYQDDSPLEIPVRVQIIGANRSLRQSLRFLLESTIDIQCVVCKGMPSGAAFIQSSSIPSVLLIDCLGYDNDTVERNIHRHNQTLPDDIRIVLFNLHDGCTIYRSEGLKALWGVFYQNDCTSIFIDGMHAILNGRRWLSRCRKEDPLQSSAWKEARLQHAAQLLSKREKEVLQLIADGMGNIKIAETLEISVHTVKTHVFNIYRKLDLPNRLQAAIWATAYLKLQASG
jgi:DNA-binding NarL/FixJ family response regulator